MDAILRERTRNTVWQAWKVCYAARKLRASSVESGHGWEASVLTTFFIFLFVHPHLTAFFGWLLVQFDQLEGLGDSVFLFSWFVAGLFINAGTPCASLREKLGVEWSGVEGWWGCPACSCVVMGRDASCMAVFINLLSCFFDTESHLPTKEVFFFRATWLILQKHFLKYSFLFYFLGLWM